VRQRQTHRSLFLKIQRNSNHTCLAVKGGKRGEKESREGGMGTCKGIKRYKTRLRGRSGKESPSEIFRQRPGSSGCSRHCCPLPSRNYTKGLPPLARIAQETLCRTNRKCGRLALPERFAPRAHFLVISAASLASDSPNSTELPTIPGNDASIFRETFNNSFLLFT